MFKQKKILAVIPARGGSKGVPRKNIRMAGGKPLIAWMIEAAQKSKYIDRLILSSDDNEIIQVAESYGCEAPFIRPAELAGDDSSSVDVVLHALRMLPGYEYVVLLQPTSPLTRSVDIDGCIESCVGSEGVSTVSVTVPSKSPYWMFHKDKANLLTPIMGKKYLNKRRQDLPEVFIPTGAVYVSEVEWIKNNKSFYSSSTCGYKIAKELTLDIDTEVDFKILESILKNRDPSIL